jgi:hypothetical protein
MELIFLFWLQKKVRVKKIIWKPRKYYSSMRLLCTAKMIYQQLLLYTNDHCWFIRIFLEIVRNMKKKKWSLYLIIWACFLWTWNNLSSPIKCWNNHMLLYARCMARIVWRLPNAHRIWEILLLRIKTMLKLWNNLP